jgi:predicted nucleotide-binding protein (sugar kinase/HSP70/actin superfamily)
LFVIWYERRLKRALSASGLVHAKPFNVKSIVNTAKPYISEHLTGEAVLTVGSSLSEVASHACGVIAIGPFGCMPNRMSESILTEIMNRDNKLASDPKNQQLKALLTEVEQLPFLAIESDGSPFPQLINAKLETFCLRAQRLHNKMIKAGS